VASFCHWRQELQPLCPLRGVARALVPERLLVLLLVREVLWVLLRRP
jgi:hypothetical protein